jgi:hypothetical protein
VAERLKAELEKQHPETEWECREWQGEWVFGVDDRWIAWVSQQDGSVEVAIFGDGSGRDEKRVFPIASPTDMEAMLPEFVRIAAWWSCRLTVYRLEPGKTYAAVQEFCDRHGTVLHPDERLVFVESNYSPYESMHVLEFEGVRVVLEESDPVVTDFDLYMRPI